MSVGKVLTMSASGAPNKLGKDIKSVWVTVPLLRLSLTIGGKGVGSAERARRDPGTQGQ